VEIRILEIGDIKIAEVVSEEVEIRDVQDGLDLLGNADYQEARRLILYERNLEPAFFDLRSGLAGEIMQKCVTYGMKLAIIGDFDKYTSSSLQALIRECNRGNDIFFVPDIETARSKLID
jgi:hypothetical protein